LDIGEIGITEASRSANGSRGPLLTGNGVSSGTVMFELTHLEEWFPFFEEKLELLVELDTKEV
tara:strand:- start:711 stop:899 length:189 start_codon:yes stop_codon:yes gene_type:complete